MIILGYILAILMGATLGLIGAGGSILTVPILVYFFKILPLDATAYSLLIVGTTALVGAISYHQKNLVNIRFAIMFAIPAMLSVLATRVLIIPNLPAKFLGIGKEDFIMMLFAALMFLAAFFMLKPITIKKIPKNNSKIAKALKIISGAAAVGFLTGMVGAGGGFLIIPALIALFGLAMKEAIGTSLAIIAINSLVGFKGDLISGIEIQWHILLPFASFTIIGMLCGIWLNKHFDGQKLKKFFAFFIIILATIIFSQHLKFIL